MKVFDRAKNIILNPRKEWEIIQYESIEPKNLITQYVLPLAAIAALATFLGLWLFGINAGITKVGGFNWGISTGISVLIQDVASVIIAAYIVDALAPSFDSEKNLEKSMQLVAYAYTPALAGGFLNIFPGISIIGSLFGLYGIYLWYIGLSPMKHTPENKKVIYLVVSIIALIIVNAIIGYIISTILGSVFSTSPPGF